MSALTVRRLADVTVGESLPARTIHVDRARLVEYAGASGDRNRIHWDERFAQQVGLPDVIAHGMFTMGAAVQVVTDWAGDGGRIVGYATKFSAPVPVPWETGADIEVTGTVKSIDEAARQAVVELTVTSGGTKVLTRALATVRLD